jgi:hypothetical protein
MLRSFGSARLATVLAVAAALIVTSVAAGAAGAALILGQANNSGTAATTVTSTNPARTVLIQNTSASGYAVDARSQGGIAGLVLSQTSTGMAGFTSTADKYAVVGTQNAGAYGNGGAFFADGRQNSGLVASTAANQADAVRAVNSALTTDFDAGYFANALYGETRAPGGNGIVGVSTAATNEGFGAYGISASPDGVGLVGDNVGGGWSGYFFSDVGVVGNLTVASCTGCGNTAVLAQAGVALAQGNAVAISGVALDETGNPRLTVRLATEGDSVVGIVDTAMTLRVGQRGVVQMVRGGVSVARGGLVSVVTRGMLVTEGTASMRGVSAGTPLGLNAAGNLAAADARAAIAYVAGSLKDGRIVLFVNP